MTRTPHRNTEAPYFSTERLSNTFPDNPEIVHEMLGVFRESLGTLQEQFAARNGDLTQLRQIMHTIKGCAGECGAAPLATVAADIESACIEGNLAAIANMENELAQALRLTLAEISSAITQA